MPDDAPTNTASGSNEEDDENVASPDVDDCHIIVNDKSTEFMLATVVEEAGKWVKLQSKTQKFCANGKFHAIDYDVAHTFFVFNFV